VFDELGQQGVNVVTFGAATSQMTEKFCVATDVQAAAQAAAEDVIKAMGGKGGILNVLEVLSDTNTLKRKAGVEAAIAAHGSDVTLVQQVADITSIDQGTQKISAAISANPDKINGIVCTGNVASSAAVQVLNDYYQRDPNAPKIYLVCIDTPDDVMNGIKSGVVYGTIAQNTFAHGYIPLLIMQMMNDGYKKVDGTYFIDSGCVLVTKDNAETFKDDLQKVTDQIKADLGTKYLTKG
jgi:ribose transport system substrate-binding protein